MISKNVFERWKFKYSCINQYVLIGYCCSLYQQYFKHITAVCVSKTFSGHWYFFLRMFDYQSPCAKGMFLRLIRRLGCSSILFFISSYKKTNLIVNIFSQFRFSFPSIKVVALHFDKNALLYPKMRVSRVVKIGKVALEQIIETNYDDTEPRGFRSPSETAWVISYFLTIYLLFLS